MSAPARRAHAALDARATDALAGQEQAIQELEIGLLLEALSQRHGYDFRDYDRQLVRRRVLGVMAACGLPTVSRLQEHVLHQPGAAGQVLRALALAPSALFDDPPRAREAREVLGKSLRSAAVPKVWLAECAGAGQAWTLAILLHEEGVLGRTDIFATLANEDLLPEMRDAAIDAAHLPALRADYLRSGGSARLDDYFEVCDGHAVLLPQLRSRITWAGYSLVTDASFNEFQAIVCCRDLADFGPALRQRVLRLFHDSLARFGVLGIDCALQPGDAHAAAYQQLGHAGWYKRVG